MPFDLNKKKTKKIEIKRKIKECNFHKGCLLEAPLLGKTLEAGVIEAEVIEAEGIGAEGIGAGGIEDRAFEASILGQTLDEPGKMCLWK